MHSLVEIGFSDWPKLRDLYGGRKRCSSAYSLILNYINWKTSESEIAAKIYALDGDWENDGTFILIDSELEMGKVYFNTLSSDTGRLRKAIDCLDTLQPQLFFAIQECHIPLLKQYFSEAGFNVDDIRIDGTIWYHIEREKALEFDTNPPEGFTISPLNVKHAFTVNSLWPHRSEGSIKFVERLIKSNDSVGAFNKDGNLVAWCLRLPVGSMGLLQVAESHRRQGFGSLVVRNMARITALKGEEVLAPVIFKNAASRSMFENLGFREIDKVYWTVRPAKEEEL